MIKYTPEKPIKGQAVFYSGSRPVDFKIVEENIEMFGGVYEVITREQFEEETHG